LAFGWEGLLVINIKEDKKSYALMIAILLWAKMKKEYSILTLVLFAG
jgi:hypothetical protein